MNNLINQIDNDKIIYIENIGSFNAHQLTAGKQLCIIKTDFKDLPQIKNFSKAYRHLDIWLTSEHITRKNIFSANSCGIKNVLQYPIQPEVLFEYFKTETRTTQNTGI